MTSLAGTHNALGTCLADLERLIFGRPATVLFTEYLAAFVVEGILDPETAERVGAVYHRSRYWQLDSDDAEYQSAVSALEPVVAKLQALTEEQRSKLAERVRDRLQVMRADPLPLPATKRLPWADFPTSDERLPVVGGNGLGPTGHARDEPFPAGEPAPVPTPRRRFSLRRLPVIRLDIALMMSVGIFFAGYLIHGVLEARRNSQNWRAALSRSGNVPSRWADRIGVIDGEKLQVWEDDELWNHNLLQRAGLEYQRRNGPGARDLYELWLTYGHDADKLNEVAWYYLTRKQLHDPRRGFELALKALALKRSSEIIDTAAEGYFQAGNVGEAIKLELEAMEALPDGPQNPRFSEYSRQLAKFQIAQKAAWPKSPAPRASAPKVSATSHGPGPKR